MRMISKMHRVERGSEICKLQSQGEKMEQHAMVVPFPAQSHMNALLDFAKLLGSRGFIITFVNTEHMHHRIFKSTQHVPAAIQSLHKRGLRFRFEFVADDLPVDHHRRGGQLIRSMQSWGPALEEFVLRVEREGPPITCIVADAFMSTPAHHLSQKLRLPRVVFWPFSAAASVAQCHTRLLLSKGYLPFKSGEAAYNVIDCLPGIPPVVRPVDLTMSHLTEEVYELFVEESDFQNKGDWVVVNSFEELEGAETTRGLSVNCPALTVGPAFEDQQRQINTTETSLWKEDEECLRWLDRHPPASVLYVSFGSIAVLSIGQVQEIALGLEASGHPFLWAMRPDFVPQSNSALLPEGLTERTRDRSLVVEWSPQREVLGHKSVGGFMTHNGWNSTLESICSGVPMIGWPVLADQFFNCKYMKDVWRVGLNFGDGPYGDQLVTKEEVEKLVRCVMEGEEGKIIRENVKRLQHLAIKAVLRGGSSHTNLDLLVQQLHDRAVLPKI